MNSQRILAATLTVACSVIGTGPAHGSGDADVHWRMAMAFPSELPALATPAPWMAERLATISDGAIRIEIAEPDDPVPPMHILEAVSGGEVEAGYTWIGYDQNTIPAVSLFASVPFGMKPWAFLAWYRFHEGEELLAEVYARADRDVHAELCGIIGPETAGWYRDPIESLADFEGLRIRFAGLGGRVLTRLGATVSTVPADEVAAALNAGTLDAAEFSLPAVDEFLGLDELVRHTLLPGWHQPFSAQYLLVNGDAWAALGEVNRERVRLACMAATNYALAESEARNPESFQRFRERGVRAERIPDNVLRRMREITDEVLDGMAADDPLFQRIRASQQAFLERYGEWEARAYLPPDL
ncbi:MAG: TRAP transporter substrate-binding protein [Arhodomonas sp.]|nr:TRAP transporter substrate-binding protein [Arhodomonas sp.]